jgi:hypothetical protein
MCYGSLDPKYAMREAEDRLKGLSFQAVARPDQTEDNTAPAPAFGLFARVRAAVARLKRKDHAHV